MTDAPSPFGSVFPFGVGESVYAKGEANWFQAEEMSLLEDPKDPSMNCVSPATVSDEIFRLIFSLHVTFSHWEVSEIWSSSIAVFSMNLRVVTSREP